MHQSAVRFPGQSAALKPLLQEAAAAAFQDWLARTLTLLGQLETKLRLAATTAVKKARSRSRQKQACHDIS